MDQIVQLQKEASKNPNLIQIDEITDLQNKFNDGIRMSRTSASANSLTYLKP